MIWLVFAYSLPSKGHSSPRVALWRRLRRLGAISPTGSMYVLPAREECMEALQWLAQEVQQAQGEALVMRVEHFEGLTDAQLIERFRQARVEDYAEIDQQAAALEQRLSPELPLEERSQRREALAKLRRQHADVARVDFFDVPEGALMASRLARMAQMLAAGETPDTSIVPATIVAYRDRRWVTRPRPHVDRLACIWLIRRFINPHAVIRYAQTSEPDEVAFDMREGAFGHRGNLCTFETMVAAFGLDDSGLRLMGEIVHDIDLRDGRYAHPETVGINAILKGWLLTRFSDTDLEAHGVALFEGLYSALARGQHRRRSAESAHALQKRPCTAEGGNP